MARISSLSEKPRGDRPMRLVDCLNPTGARKVHSLVDKIYKKNLEMAWKKVRENKGCGGIDGQSNELRSGKYQPKPVLQHLKSSDKQNKAGRVENWRAFLRCTSSDKV